MKCPYCQSTDLKVIDSRPVPEDNTIRRRRECNNCHNRFTTFEIIKIISITVIKRDGSSQLYDREKLITGIARSCQKRPVSRQQMENIASELEKYIYANFPKREITSKEIGQFVLAELKKLDLVSYIRFASVYRQFKDLNSFVDELKRLEEEKPLND